MPTPPPSTANSSASDNGTTSLPAAHTPPLAAAQTPPSPAAQTPLLPTNHTPPVSTGAQAEKSTPEPINEDEAPKQPKPHLVKKPVEDVSFFYCLFFFFLIPYSGIAFWDRLWALRCSIRQRANAATSQEIQDDLKTQVDPNFGKPHRVLPCQAKRFWKNGRLLFCCPRCFYPCCFCPRRFHHPRCFLLSSAQFFFFTTAAVMYSLLL